MIVRFRRGSFVGLIFLRWVRDGGLRGSGLICWMRVHDVKSPYQPRHDEISRLDERRCDDGCGGGEEPEEKEAGSWAIAGRCICWGWS